jgi:rod shape determining protein RodA
VLFTGIRARWVIALALGAAMALGIGWHWGLKPYQKDRIMVFLDPAREPKGYGYNVIQSRVAIGSGGFWGKGFGEGSQGAGRFLPESSTDFIFAVIAEEQGLLGVAALFTFFGMLWWRLIWGGRRAGHNFARIVLFGAAWLLVLHFAINVGMNLGLLPVIGLPLPFVSYGGSHVLAEFILVGICLALLAERSSTGPSPDVSAGGTPFPLSVDSGKNDAS